MINQGRLECKYNPLVPEQQAFLQLTCQQHDSLHLPKNKIEALENTWPKTTHNVKGKLYWSSRLLLGNEAFELFIAIPPPELLKTVIFLIHFKTVNIINCIYRMHFRLPPEGAPAAAADQDTPDECANHAQSLPLQWSGTCFGVIHFPEFVIQFWGKYVTQVGQSGNRLGCRFFVHTSVNSTASIHLEKVFEDIRLVGSSKRSLEREVRGFIKPHHHLHFLDLHFTVWLYVTNNNLTKNKLVTGFSIW